MHDAICGIGLCVGLAHITKFEFIITSLCLLQVLTFILDDLICDNKVSSSHIL